MKSDCLSPLQVYGAQWMSDRPGSALFDCPGLGKTRTAMAACEDAPFVTVVAPAAIRDAQVWQREAAEVGFDTPMRVISYHELAKRPVDPGGALVFDESHHIKSRKVSWGQNAEKAASMSIRTHLLSGTPMPNAVLTELYSQMKLVNPDIPASYWRWARQWFAITSNRYSQYVVDGTLLGCVDKPCAVAGWPDCEHRSAFWQANCDGFALRRPESALDLPDMAGNDTPLDAPMTARQKSAYASLKKAFLADLPEEGITLEALTASSRFVQLLQASAGLSSVEPDPALDKHSGKAALISELLPDRANPTVLGVYFKNTAAAMARLCDRLGLSYVEFGANTSARARGEAVDRFQSGNADVLIGSVSVISEGITLTAADQVIMCERSWVPSVNLQTVRRVQRRGQTKSVIVRQLVAPGTVDAAQWGRLQSKDAVIRGFMSRAEVRRLVG